MFRCAGRARLLVEGVDPLSPELPNMAPESPKAPECRPERPDGGPGASSGRIGPRPGAEARVREFGPFRMDLDRLCLWKDGELVDLARLPASVLAHLIEKDGEVVLRTELRDRFWSPDAIGFDDRLNTCIRAVRAALGDAAARPRHIGTVRGRGYRFLGQAVPPSPQPAPRSMPTDRSPRPPARRHPGRHRRGWRPAVALAGLGVLVAAASSALLGRRGDAPSMTVVSPAARRAEGMSARAATRPSVETGPSVPAVFPEIVPTSHDVEAWDAYLRASATARDAESPGLADAARLYEEAVTRDPSFVPGYAGLAVVRSELGWRRQDPVMLVSARDVAQRVASLSDDSGEGALALGVTHLYERQWSAAVVELERARRERPGDGRVLAALGEAQRRRGRWAESDAAFEDLLALDPFSARAPLSLAMNHGRLRDYAGAERYFVRAAALDPGNAEIYVRRAVQRLRWTGNRAETLEVLVDGAERSGTSVEALALSVRELGRVLGPDVARGWPGDEPAGEPHWWDGQGCVARYTRAWLLVRGGHAREGRALLSELAVELRRAVGEEGAWIGVPTRQGILGLTLALLGERDEARERADAILAAFPPGRDALTSAYLRVMAAEILAGTGDLDRAFEVVREQLARPSTLSRAMLRADPIWEPLRRHPNWGALVERP